MDQRGQGPVTLTERHQAERELGEQFSQWRRVEDIDLDLGFDSMRLIRERMLEILGDVQGKKVIDVGCGLGRLSVALARRGALVTALDIAEGMLDFTRRLADRYGVSDRICLVQGEGERLPFPDGAFDLVVGSGVLHHLKLDLALPEIRRVLRDSGYALFEEPLGHNPFLNIYRRLTPKQRSKYERPFLWSDFARFKAYFSEVDHEEHYFVAIPLFWLKKYMSINWGKRMITLAASFDERLMQAFSFVRRYSWVTVILLRR